MENRENDMEKAGSSPLLEVEHLEVSFLPGSCGHGAFALQWKLEGRYSL